MCGAETAAVASDAEDHQLAAAYLSRVAEPGCLPLFELVGEVGYVAAAELVRAGRAKAAVRSATEARAATADPTADLEAAQQSGIRLLTPRDAEWPHLAFAALHCATERRARSHSAVPPAPASREGPGLAELLPPLALWVKGAGDLSALSTRSVAVVGSRAATAYGEHVGSELAYGLAIRDVAVVSGGAYGIDAAAHRGALAADGVAVLVSAGGLDRPYPAGNQSLFERVAERGALVSERPPGSAPQRQRFLSRNRLIAALGSATLVIEAAVRSGALNTARYARQLGRPVLGVPGPISSAMSAGVHDLIRRDVDPARLVTSVAEILEAITMGVDPAPGDATCAVAERASWSSAVLRPSLDGLDLTSRLVYDGFPVSRWVTEAEVAQLSGRPLAEVVQSLPVLVHVGLVERSGHRHRRISVAS